MTGFLTDAIDLYVADGQYVNAGILRREYRRTLGLCPSCGIQHQPDHVCVRDQIASGSDRREQVARLLARAAERITP